MKKLIYFIAGAVFSLSATALAATTIFTDQGNFADWYQDAVLNMNKKGIITGYEDGSFGASNNVNRAELAVMFDRFDTYLANHYIPTYIKKDSGVNLKLKKGQEFSVRLSDPGDGGFNFDPLEFSKSVLNISTYQNLGPIYWGGSSDYEGAYTAGDFGNKIWTFVTKNTGETDLIISISRPWVEGSSQVEFEAHIVVEE